MLIDAGSMLDYTQSEATFGACGRRLVVDVIFPFADWDSIPIAARRATATAADHRDAPCPLCSITGAASAA
jgi:hypothetical protein